MLWRTGIEAGDLHAVVLELEKVGLEPKEAKLVMLPKTTIEVEANVIKSVLALMEALEDNDDVQDVFSNVEITDEAMAAVMGE